MNEQEKVEALIEDFENETLDRTLQSTQWWYPIRASLENAKQLAISNDRASGVKDLF